MSLSREEMARAKFTFSIYDFDGTNKIDAFQLGNALRALGLCPSLKKISNLGGTIQRGEKMLDVEEFLAIYQDAKKEKEETGTLEDYLEALSSHDKDRSGKVSIQTLGHLLQSYGDEKLDRLEVEEVITDCGDPDDDGMVDYRYFLKNLMKGPEIKIPMAMLRATEDADDSGFDFSGEHVTDGMVAFTNQNYCPTEEDQVNPSESLLLKSSSQSVEDRTTAGFVTGLERTGSIGVCDETMSPENDISATTDTYQGDASSKNSRLSVKDQGESDRGLSPDGSSISDGDTLSGKAPPAKKPGGKTKKAKVADGSIEKSDSGGDLSGARNLLKSKAATAKQSSTGSAAVEAKLREKKKEEPEVKPKFQQPLISLKTAGLFGGKK